MPDLDARAVLSLLRRAVVFELRLYRSLFRWVTRRRDVGGPDTEVFRYDQAVTPVMWVWIFASGIEIPFVDMLIPWPTVRLVAIALGVWGLMWMVGMLASLKVYPHLLSDTALRVRNGAAVDLVVPWTEVASIAVRRRDLPSSMRTLQPRETETGTDLQVGVSGQVNVHTVLRRPVTVPTPQGGREITALSFLADDPGLLVRRAREHLAAAATSRDHPAAGSG